MLNKKGFTLLEILVALTIIATAMASFVTLLSQSKRLSINGRKILRQTMEQRVVLNAFQLQTEDDSYLLEKSASSFTAKAGKRLLPPERQTKPVLYALESYNIVGPQGDGLLACVRWKKLDSLQ